jgi:hypothetical protein
MWPAFEDCSVEKDQLRTCTRGQPNALKKSEGRKSASGRAKKEWNLGLIQYLTNTYAPRPSTAPVIRLQAIATLVTGAATVRASTQRASVCPIGA